MKAATAYRRVLRMICERQSDALMHGRYPPPKGRPHGRHDHRDYEKRDKSKAFRCMGYMTAIQDVSALTEAAVLLKIQADREAALAAKEQSRE